MAGNSNGKDKDQARKETAKHKGALLGMKRTGKTGAKGGDGASPGKPGKGGK